MDGTLKAALGVAATEIILVAGVLAWDGNLAGVRFAEVVCLSTGWGFVLSTGVFLRHPARWLGVGAYAIGQFIEIRYGAPFGWIPALAAVILALILTAALIQPWERRYLKDRIGRSESRFKVLVWLTFTALALGVYVVETLARLLGAFSGLGLVDTILGPRLDPVLLQLAALQLVLIPFLLIAGSDWAELSLAAVESVGRGLERIRLDIVIDLAAGVVAGYELVAAGWRLPLADLPLLAWELVMAGSVIGAVFWLARRGRVRRESKVQYRAAIGAAAVTMAAAYGANVLHLSGIDVRGAGQLFAAGLWLAVVIGLVVLVLGRTFWRGRLSPAWLLVATVGAVYLVDGANTIRSHVWRTDQTLALGMLQGLAVVAAVTTLLALAVAVRGGRSRQAARQVARSMLAFVLAVHMLGLVSQAYQPPPQPRLPVAEALVLVLALGWELATSGKSVLNRDGRTMTRQVRGFLFCAYLVVVAADLLFNSTLARELQLEKLPDNLTFEVDQFVQGGVAILAIPVLIFVTITNVRRAVAGLGTGGAERESRRIVERHGLESP